MANKIDQANYLSSLIIIMEAYEKLGSPRHPLVVAEYQRINADFLHTLANEAQIREFSK